MNFGRLLFYTPVKKCKLKRYYLKDTLLALDTVRKL